MPRRQRSRQTARLSHRQPLGDAGGLQRGGAAPCRSGARVVAHARSRQHRAAVSRLPDAAGLRGRQYAGRHRPLARLDAARPDAAIHRAAEPDHRLHRRRLRARLPARRRRRDGGEPRRGVDRDDRAIADHEPPAARRGGARPQDLRFRQLAQDLAADPDGRGLLSAVVVLRRAGAAAVPLGRGGRQSITR